MFSLCGYYTKEVRPDFDDNVICNMYAGLHVGANDKIDIINGKNYSFAVVNGWCSTNKSKETVKSIITGTPYWNNDKYKNIASKAGHADALIEAYINHGVEAFNFIGGQFALTIIDESNNNLLFAVDRMGIQPITYTSNDDFIVFGSTTDSINYFPLQQSSISQQSILDYLFFHMVPSPGSIYHGVNKLLPAQYYTYNGRMGDVKEYWLPTFHEKTTDTIDQQANNLRSHLRNSVVKNITSDHVGSFLSGGLDSTTVSGILSQNTAEANTFSIGFDAEGYDEIEYVRIAEKYYNLNSYKYYVTPEDVAKAIPIIANYYDEPYGNSSAIPAYYCALLAKNNGIKTLLAGDGGDELFAGNERYKKQLMFESYYKIPEILRNRLIEPLFNSTKNNLSFFPLNKIRSYIQQSNIPLPDRLETYNFLLRGNLGAILDDNFISTTSIKHPLNLLNETYNKIPDISAMNRMLFLDWKQTLADNDLRKVNKMCYLAGIDVQYPMIDNELVDFSITIPSARKLHKNQLRYFYKYSLRNILPVEILKKPKQGFGLPFGVWLKTSPQLKEIVMDSVSSFRGRQILKSQYIDWLLDKHDTGHSAFYGTTLWVIMMLELWLQNHE